MDAFRRLLEGDLPPGSTGLDEDAVKAYSAELYRLDGEISYERAQVMGRILSELDASQRAYLDVMVGQGMLDWPDVEEPSDTRGLDRDVKVAVMTYAGDMFSWYAGSVEADVYFCPERQGTYFGSFYLKDAPAMGNPNYTIPSNLTGDMGSALLETLTPDQTQLVTSLVDIQRPYLLGIIEARREVSTELRRFMAGESVDRDTMLSLMDKYGELDGAIVYSSAVNFAQVNQTLTTEQKAQLMALRKEMLGGMLYPSGAYLYSQPIAMPEIPNTDFLFATK
jgi:Spy/CpxP family protein refolding chaperone